MKLGAYDKRGAHGYAPGVFPSMELLNSRPDAVRELLYRREGLRNEGVAELIDACRTRGIRVEEAPRALERIAGKENCYAAAVFEKYENPLDERVSHLVLCGVSDMGNLGTIIRTAVGFGVTDIAIVRPAADAFDPRVVRASMGALFRANIAYFDDYTLYEAIAGEREAFFFRLRNAVPLDDIQRSGTPFSLVFGNESSGLTGELLTKGTGIVIPHSGAIDSLNLSVAVGIGLYAFRREETSWTSCELQ